MKVACGVWIIAIAIFSTCAVLFTINRMKNSDRLIQAQIEQTQKVTEQVGKPQIVETRYVTVKEGK